MGKDSPSAADVLFPATGHAALFNELLNAFPAHLALLDAQGRIAAVNESWVDFCRTNGGPIDSWMGRDYRDFCAQAPAIAAAITDILAERADRFAVDYPCHGPDVERWFRCLLSPLNDQAGGDRCGLVVAHIDVTEQKLAERAAKQADDAKTRFLTDVSHEMRTPLNAVIGFAEMIEAQVWGPIGDRRYVEYANDIRHSAGLLLDLINQLLDMAKIESGSMELHEESVDFGDLVRSVGHLMEPLAGAVQVELRIEPDATMPAIAADPRLVRQILLNLASNAIKFTPSGGCVTLACGLFAADRRPFVAVRDTGIGIAADQLEQVRKPFVQIDSPTARRSHGTGLGLALCDQFIRLHGGEMRIDSVEGQGTSVAALFPPSRILNRGN